MLLRAGGHPEALDQLHQGVALQGSRACFSRNRNGRHGCQADRLPAEALERAVIESIQATYAYTDLIDRALAGARRRADAAVPSVRAELHSVEARIGKAEQALERYFIAFESGTLTRRRFAA